MTISLSLYAEMTLCTRKNTWLIFWDSLQGFLFGIVLNLPRVGSSALFSSVGSCVNTVRVDVTVCHKDLDLCLFSLLGCKFLEAGDILLGIVSLEHMHLSSVNVIKWIICWTNEWVIYSWATRYTQVPKRHCSLIRGYNLWQRSFRLCMNS